MNTSTYMCDTLPPTVSSISHNLKLPVGLTEKEKILLFKYACTCLVKKEYLKSMKYFIKKVTWKKDVETISLNNLLCDLYSNGDDSSSAKIQRKRKRKKNIKAKKKVTKVQHKERKTSTNKRYKANIHTIPIYNCKSIEKLILQNQFRYVGQKNLLLMGFVYATLVGTESWSIQSVLKSGAPAKDFQLASDSVRCEYLANSGWCVQTLDNTQRAQEDLTKISADIHVSADYLKLSSLQKAITDGKLKRNHFQLILFEFVSMPLVSN